MNVSKVKNLSFKRALKESEIADYKKTMEEARKLLGTDGSNVLIVPDTSLPTSGKSIIGNISDEKALEFADFMKTYLGINAIEYLPQGDFHENSDRFNPYNATTLTYPKHLINLESFTKKEFGELLKPEEIKTNTNSEGTGRSKVHFKEVYDENSNFNETLKIAYSRFDKTNPLWQEFLDYRKENDENIIPRVLFTKLIKEHGEYETSKWPEPDATLFKDVDENKKARLEELKSKYKDEIDFYAFEQFFAHKNLQYSKEKLNKMGIDLVGDCPIRFSEDEIWANPDACKNDIFIGKPNWRIKALDYQKLFDENGEPMPSMQLLGKKFTKMLKDYDSIRVDCGWCYIQPSLYDRATGKKKYVNSDKNKVDDKILNYLDKLAKEVKGEDFDLNKIMYEVEVGSDADFYAIDDKEGVIPPLKDRVKIFTTVHADTTSKNHWGTLSGYRLLGVDYDKMILGTGNHDHEPLRNFSKGDKPLTEREIELSNNFYSNYFNYRKEFKNKQDFTIGKRAEIALAKNQMHFFYDIFGWKLNEDEKKGDLTKTYYATKINEDFKKEYLDSLKAGTGYNPMEILQIAFLNDSSDKFRAEHKDIYQKVKKYSKILKEEEPKEPKKTEVTSTNKTDDIKQEDKINTPNTDKPDEKKNNENKDGRDKVKNKSVFVAIGAIIAGLAAIGAFIRSKFKKKPEKKEKV